MTKIDGERDTAWMDALEEERFFIDTGLLEPGQPTRAAHLRERERIARMFADFTPDERFQIRLMLKANKSSA